MVIFHIHKHNMTHKAWEPVEMHAKLTPDFAFDLREALLTWLAVPFPLAVASLLLCSS